MRKVHDVLRLHFGLKMPQRQIARSIQVSQSTVSEYLTRFEQSGLSWPLPESFDDHRLQQKLFGSGSDKPERIVARPLPDFEQIRHELATKAPGAAASTKATARRPPCGIGWTSPQDRPS
jgi:DNA-binding transcriptional regulator LsrR (DeoR family)